MYVKTKWNPFQGVINIQSIFQKFIAVATLFHKFHTSIAAISLTVLRCDEFAKKITEQKVIYYLNRMCSTQLL